MARQMKETPGNWVMTGARFVPVAGAEPEEAEEEQAEQADTSLAARLAKVEAEARLPFTEPELVERKRTFQYLKDFRKRKRLGLEHPERQAEARERARAAVGRILQEDAERSARETERAAREITSGGAMAAKRTSTPRRTPTDGIDDDIPYVRDENSELVPYVPPPRRFTEEDRKRANKNRDRYTRAAWGKKLRAIAEGRVTVTKEQFQAHLAYGRFRGWNRRSPGQR